MIRFAVVDDVPRIAEIHVETWRAAYRDLIPPQFLADLSVEQRADGWRRGIAANPRLVLVSEGDRGQIGGWIAVGPARDADASSAGEIYALYVAPECWRRGIGRALMARGEEELRARGFARVVLWVLEANQRGCRFYEALSYARDGAGKDAIFGETMLREVRYEKGAASPGATATRR
jgi:ribosomal protein S18 acetylase RimI-like enzyme